MWWCFVFVWFHFKKIPNPLQRSDKTFSHQTGLVTSLKLYFRSMFFFLSPFWMDVSDAHGRNSFWRRQFLQKSDQFVCGYFIVCVYVCWAQRNWCNPTVDVCTLYILSSHFTLLDAFWKVLFATILDFQPFKHPRAKQSVYVYVCQEWNGIISSTDKEIASSSFKSNRWVNQLHWIILHFVVHRK